MAGPSANRGISRQQKRPAYIDGQGGDLHARCGGLPFFTRPNGPRPPIPPPAPVHCPAPTRRGTGTKAWLCHYVPGAAPAPAKAGELRPGEKGLLLLRGPGTRAEHALSSRNRAIGPGVPYPHSHRSPDHPRTKLEATPGLIHGSPKRQRCSAPAAEPRPPGPAPSSPGHGASRRRRAATG